MSTKGIEIDFSMPFVFFLFLLRKIIRNLRNWVPDKQYYENLTIVKKVPIIPLELTIKKYNGKFIILSAEKKTLLLIITFNNLA